MTIAQNATSAGAATQLNELPDYRRLGSNRNSIRSADSSTSLSTRADCEAKPVNSTNHNSKLRVAKRIVVAVIGGTVTLIGVALIVLPGPAIVVIPIGLSILASQFVWARRYLEKARRIATRGTSKTRQHT